MLKAIPRSINIGRFSHKTSANLNIPKKEARRPNTQTRKLTTGAPTTACGLSKGQKNVILVKQGRTIHTTPNPNQYVESDK